MVWFLTLAGGALLTVNWLTFIYIVNHINIKTASFLLYDLSGNHSRSWILSHERESHTDSMDRGWTVRVELRNHGHELGTGIGL